VTVRSAIARMRMQCIVLFSILCVVEIAALSYLRHESTSYKQGQVLPLPDGIDLGGRYVAHRPGACYLIRITADGCPYCKQDAPYYTDLASYAHERGCFVFAMAPRAGAMKATGGVAVELKYVSMELSDAFDVSATPGTVLLDHTGRVVWQRRGAMSDADHRQARSVLAHVAVDHTQPASVPDAPIPR
jgi:thioredoxin-related protein